MKKWLSEIRRGEAGIAIPIAMSMLLLGSLLIVPSLNYVSTNLKIGQMVEENLAGIYTADAGVEDALWRLKNDKPTSFPYSYQVSDINGMTVDVVIDEITTIAGEEVGDSGGHEDWLVSNTSINYNAETEIYDYTMSLTNDGSGNIKIVKILIILPPQLEYVEGSTSGDITTDDPTVVGDSNTGITLIWEMSPAQYPTIPIGTTSEHCFQLRGPPDIEGVEGNGIVEAHRDDIGTVWINESHPYSITAQAKDASDAVVATIRAGVWEGSQMDISCWQVNP
ncbi:hypothetical protein ACFLXD_06110 [Chloroflexota bacterium]